MTQLFHRPSLGLMVVFSLLSILMLGGTGHSGGSPALVAAQMPFLPSPRVEVDIAFFGYPGTELHTFQGHSQYSVSGPSYEVAVEHLQRRYNATFHFNYLNSGAHTCLNVVQEPGDVLADFYYRRRVSGGPSRVVGFVNPGWEPGTSYVAFQFY